MDTNKAITALIGAKQLLSFNANEGKSLAIKECHANMAFWFVVEALDHLQTPQPSPVATRAETEAAPELVAEAQGHSKRPVGFRFRDSASKTGWGLTQSEDWAANADPNYQGLYVRDGR